MTTEHINKLKGERVALVKESRRILDTASSEKRNLTADESEKVDQIYADVDAKTKSIEQLEKQQRIESALKQERDSDFRPNSDQPSNKTGRNSDAYRSALFGKGGYARVGNNGLTAQHLNVLNEGTNAQGGYLVPEEFETQIVKLLTEGNPIRAGATVISTASDRNIPVETGLGSFAYVAESASYGTSSDPAVGQVVLEAHKAGGIVKVSEELLLDAFFDIENWLIDVAGRRFAELEDTSFADGNGTGKPHGLFQTSTVANVTVEGETGGTSATAAITGDDLVDVYHKLKRVYRDRATWLTSDAAIKLIRKLKGEDDQYLWQPGLIAGEPDRILGRPVIVSDGAPNPAPDAKSIMFGDLSYYYIADRQGTAMQRLVELYAGNGQVGFKFHRRHDGKLVNGKSFVYFKHGPAS